MASEDITNKISSLIQEYEDDLKKLYNEIIPSQPEDKALYHYTSLRNLERIIGEQHLTYTHIEDLNDPSEIHYAIQILEGLIENIKSRSFEESWLGPNIREEIWAEFLRIFNCNISQNLFQKEKNNGHFKNIKDIKTTLYTFSFSSRADNLPMWRWYGDNGAGVSIGFRSSYFGFGTEEMNDSVNLRTHAPCVYSQVMYEIKEFKEFVLKGMNLFENRILNFIDFCRERKISGNEFEKQASTLQKDLYTSFASHLLPLLPSIKHPGYKEEDEHRTYYLEYIVRKENGEEVCETGKLDDKCKFSTTPKQLVCGSFEFRVGKLTNTMKQWFENIPTSAGLSSLLKALECKSIQAFDELNKEVQQQRVKKAIASMKALLNEEVGREDGDDVENLINFHCPKASQGDTFYPLVFYKSLVCDTCKAKKSEHVSLTESTSTEIRRYKSDQFSFNDIAEIWIGPRLDFKLTMSKIISMLKEKGYDTSLINTTQGICIKQSKMPYR